MSFKHRGFLDGTFKPKLAAIYRMRPELSWADVTRQWKEKKHSPSAGMLFYPKPVPSPHLILSCLMPFSVKVPRLRSQRKDRRPRGFWMQIENRRRFFNDLATKLNIDTSEPENWHALTPKIVHEHKVSLSSNRNKHVSLLLTQYPHKKKKKKGEGIIE